MDVPVSTQGIGIAQLLTMLQAAHLQGATHVQIASRMPGCTGASSDIDWVSMAPVNGVVYVGALAEVPNWTPMSNAALESLDW